MDRRVGNTKKMGALFGILAAIGGPIPEPETIPYAFFILSNRLSSILKSEHSPNESLMISVSCVALHVQVTCLASWFVLHFCRLCILCDAIAVWAAYDKACIPCKLQHCM